MALDAFEHTLTRETIGRFLGDDVLVCLLSASNRLGRALRITILEIHADAATCYEYQLDSRYQAVRQRAARDELEALFEYLDDDPRVERSTATQRAWKRHCRHIYDS